MTSEPTTKAAREYMQGVYLGWTAPIARAEEWVPKIEAEAVAAALTSLRERVTGLLARHPDHVGGPEVQLGQVLTEIDRALGD